MVKPTLLVLAAGMGSRYGSLKQMDGVGPNNEAIIDYSVYDAIRAGFGKVVFVIRHSFEKEFREVFSADRFGGPWISFSRNSTTCPKVLPFPKAVSSRGVRTTP